jgi:murein DD-endopeptidase MepM/ murein hydrolase activator NlpD
MVDKRIPLIYSVLMTFLISIMTICMILLFVEYRFFCRQVQELSVLKEQYTFCIDILQKKINGDSGQDDVIEDIQEIELPEETEEIYDITHDSPEETSLMMDEIAAAESSDAPDNDDEYVDDFVIINRQPDYLKQSTLDYIESQELNSLMTAIDIDRWSDYTPVPTTRQDELRNKPKRVVQTVEKKPGTIVAKTSQIDSTHTKKNGITRRPLKECAFVWPIDANKFWLSSLFGPRKRIDGTWGFHHGIDMAAVKGTAVKAARAGTVTEASFQAGYGNTVVIQHSANLSTRYAHLHAIRVYVGHKVKQGTIVGTVGETGFVRKKGKDGSHLHFEVYEGGKRINPMHCLPRMT